MDRFTLLNFILFILIGHSGWGQAPTSTPFPPGVIPGVTSPTSPGFNQPPRSSYDPTDDLMAAFGSTCSSVGKNTLSALDQTASLKAVVEALKNDTTCTEIVHSLNGIIEASSYMSSLLSPSLSGWQYQQKEAEIGQLLAAISVETDPIVRGILSNQLAMKKVEHIRLGFDGNFQRKHLSYAAAGNFLNYSERALASLSTQTACMASRPGLRYQVAGQILAASAAFFTYPAGVAIYGAGYAINQLVKYFSERGYNKLLKKASLSRLSVSMGCVLESLSTSYCQSRDTLALIKVNGNSRAKDEKPDWYGITMLTRDLSNYHTWINRIVAGAAPANQAAATQKAKGELYEAALRISSSKMKADLQVGEERERRAPENQKVNIRRLTLKDIESRISSFVIEAGGGTPITMSGVGLSEQSPFFQIFLYDLNCGVKNYLITGEHKPVANTTNAFSPCPNNIVTPPDNLVPEIPVLRERVDRLLELTGQVVANEVALYRENDFLSVLAKSEISGNNLNVAQEFLTKVNSYLYSLQTKYGDRIPPFTSNLIVDTEQIVNSVFEILGSTKEAELKVSQVQQALAPKLDPYFLAKRLNDIVQWDLTQKINAGEFDSQLTMIFRETLRDSLDIPKEIGVLQLDKLHTDASLAQAVTFDNLVLVGNLFDDQLEDIFKGLKKKMKNPQTTSEAFRRQLQVICMQSLLIPNAPKIKRGLDLQEFCKGQVWNSVYSGSNLKLSFDELVSKPFESRVCSVFDFYRKSNIYGKAQ